MAAVSDLVPDVRTDIPELPSFVAERQLLRATRQFCEETRAWRVDIQLSTTANVPTINLTSLLPTNTELVDIISIKTVDGGAPVEPKTQRWLDENMSDWRSETNDLANYYMLESNNTIRLAPTPTDTIVNTYYARVAVKPLLAATVINDLVINKHRESLIHGALSRLFLIPRKPWTDGGLGQYHLNMFVNSFGPARRAAADEYQTGVARKVKYGGL